MTRITCALITAGEPTLEAAIASVRPHVDEVVGVYTRSTATDHVYPPLADRIFPLFDRCEVSTAFSYPSDNGAMDGIGGLADFAAARNASFDLATGDWVLWMDSDDILIGGENLRSAIALVESIPRVRMLAKYEYAMDDKGRVVVEQWRERIVRRGDPFRWHRPVHEYLVADDGNNGDVRLDTVTWRHQRPVNQPYSGRNLRILRDYAESLGEPGKSDPWLQLNLGLELQRAGEFTEAIQRFESYVHLSDRNDEKALACVAAAECAHALGPMSWTKQDEAIEWTHAARVYRDCFETRYAEAKIQFVRGMTDRPSLEQAKELLHHALSLGPTATPLAVRPVDRLWMAPDLLRVTCETLEDWSGAAEVTRRMLEHSPSDALLSLQLRRYDVAAKRATGERHPATATDGLDIVFACGPSVETWNPAIVAEKGMGGSETAVVEMSKRLAALGHRVRVITDCGEPSMHDGAWWLPTPYIADLGDVDIAIVWRNAAMLDCCHTAKARIVWAHDVHVANMTPERALWAERVLGLSAWHCEELRKAHGLHPSQVVQTRNGIDVSRFENPPSTRDPHRAIYSSSPDRGLAVLLDLWPQIREQVPDAELYVYYGFDGLDDAAKRTGNEMLRYYSHAMKRRMVEMANMGVTYHGRVDQVTLAQAMMGAGVWPYLTWFSETSCISAMEAQAAGLRIVTSPIAALPETVGDRGHVMEVYSERGYMVEIDSDNLEGAMTDWLDPSYQKAFTRYVVMSMLGTLVPNYRRVALMEYARKNFSWDGVATQWQALFDELLEDARNGAIVPYQGAAQ